MNDEIKWSTYDSMIQAYRSNMISSQAFLLAVGAIVVDKSIIILLICFAIAVIQLWYIWYRVIRCRAIISDFYKFGLSSLYDKCGNALKEDKEPLNYDIYVKNKKIRKQVNKAYAIYRNNPKYKTNMRVTRFKLDVLIPITFSILWIALVLHGLNIF